MLAAHGKQAVFLIPRRQPGLHTPDIMMNGEYWEIKSLKGKSRNAIQKRMSEATKQSANVIIDIQATKLTNAFAMREILHQSKKINGLKQLIVINKSQQLVTIK